MVEGDGAYGWEVDCEVHNIRVRGSQVKVEFRETASPQVSFNESSENHASIGRESGLWPPYPDSLYA